jgi:peptidoglycan/xylan/chitin deacetylase (PgdA/CDA1 family)
MSMSLKNHQIVGISILLVAVFILVGCSGLGSAGSAPLSSLFKSSPTPTFTVTPLPPTETPTPQPTNTPEPTFTPTQELVQVEAGKTLDVPILLYHHISDKGPGNRYFVSPEVFDQQMKWLSDHGYQTITISQLSDLILYGGQMPKKPVVITFDDGDADMVSDALPILQKYNFVATAFLIVKWIDAPQYITSDQVGELVKAGWEIGSHSMSHIDLTQNEGTLAYEIGESRTRLNEKFGLDVKSFAYPFGMIDKTVVNVAANSGYHAAVGLGNTYQQGLFDLYYLVRMEVRQEYSMDEFINLLPWKD